jgi:hypothetical protein
LEVTNWNNCEFLGPCLLNRIKASDSNRMIEVSNEIVRVAYLEFTCSEQEAGADSPSVGRQPNTIDLAELQLDVRRPHPHRNACGRDAVQAHDGIAAAIHPGSSPNQILAFVFRDKIDDVGGSSQYGFYSAKTCLVIRWAEFIFCKFCRFTDVSFRSEQLLHDLDKFWGSTVVQDGVCCAHVWAISRLYRDSRLFVKSEVAEPVLSQTRVRNCLALGAIVRYSLQNLGARWLGRLNRGEARRHVGEKQEDAIQQPAWIIPFTSAQLFQFSGCHLRFASRQSSLQSWPRVP